MLSPEIDTLQYVTSWRHDKQESNINISGDGRSTSTYVSGLLFPQSILGSFPEEIHRNPLRSLTSSNRSIIWEFRSILVHSRHSSWRLTSEEISTLGMTAERLLCGRSEGLFFFCSPCSKPSRSERLSKRESSRQTF